jgi:DNA-binding beta-propeller fold protein YncE
LKQPAYSIDLSNEILTGPAGKKKSKSIMPSAIAINPRTGELFITDGPGSRLLILANSGDIKQVHNLGKDFAQPEGITFSPAGDMFISNEGTKNPGNILKVAIQ